MQSNSSVCGDEHWCLYTSARYQRVDINVSIHGGRCVAVYMRVFFWGGVFLIGTNDLSKCIGANIKR